VSRDGVIRHANGGQILTPGFGGYVELHGGKFLGKNLAAIAFADTPARAPPAVMAFGVPPVSARKPAAPVSPVAQPVAAPVVAPLAADVAVAVEERWLPLDGFPGHEVSNRSNVRETATGKLLPLIGKNLDKVILPGRKGRKTEKMNVERFVSKLFGTPMRGAARCGGVPVKSVSAATGHREVYATASVAATKVGAAASSIIGWCDGKRDHIGAGHTWSYPEAGEAITVQRPPSKPRRKADPAAAAAAVPLVGDAPAVEEQFDQQSASDDEDADIDACSDDDETVAPPTPRESRRVAINLADDEDEPAAPRSPRPRAAGVHKSKSYSRHRVTVHRFLYDQVSGHRVYPQVAGYGFALIPKKHHH
jgi:hypothetical protein